jgi:hypothetical protein
MLKTGQVVKCVFEPNEVTPACAMTTLGFLKMSEIPNSPHGK